MMLARICAIALVLVSLTPAAWAQPLLVPQDYPTIQEAINAAVPGDTVLVDDGCYIERIDFLGKAITIESVNGPDFTIIDGNQQGTVVTCVGVAGGNRVGIGAGGM